MFTESPVEEGILRPLLSFHTGLGSLLLIYLDLWVIVYVFIKYSPVPILTSCGLISANRTVTSLRSPSMELLVVRILSAKNLGV